MKVTKYLAAAFAAAALVSTASADVTIHISGSTAYRANVYNALLNKFNAGSGFQYAFSGATIGKATFAEFRGNFPGVTGVVTVKTAFNGSGAGVQEVSNNVAIVFPVYDASLATGGAANQANPAGATAETVAPEVCLSDVFQTTTPFNTTTLTDTLVGVVPFVWVASNGSPAGLNNVTPQLVQYLFTSSGKVTLSSFTGAAADETNNAVATGRDPDSGTRLTAFAESGVGVTAAVKQFKPTASGTAIGSLVLYPRSTINGITVATGNGGESSGGTLAGNLRLSGSTGTATANGYLITYLGTNDAGGTALAATGTGAGPAVQLAYNGVNLSLAAPNTDGVVFLTDNTPVTEGKYTFWGYEHLDYLPSFTGDGKTVADALAVEIGTNTAIITLPAMHVGRTGDGLLVTSSLR